VFGIDPDVTIGVNDAVEGNVPLSIVPGFAEYARDTLRGHGTTTSRSRDASISSDSTIGYRKCDFHYAFAKGKHTFFSLALDAERYIVSGAFAFL